MTPTRDNPYSRTAFSYAANQSRTFRAGFIVAHAARILTVCALLGFAYLSVH